MKQTLNLLVVNIISIKNLTPFALHSSCLVLSRDIKAEISLGHAISDWNFFASEKLG